MPTRLILLALITQIVLTLIVYLRLNSAKRAAVRRGEVDETRRALDEDAWPDSVRKINNNIRNQFELPVLFYTMVLTLVALDAAGTAAAVCAWLFVSSRIVHAWIHTGSNDVPWRRRAFMVGWLMVMALAVVAIYALATK